MAILLGAVLVIAGSCQACSYALRRAAAAGIPAHPACWPVMPVPASCSSAASAAPIVESVALALILFDGGLKTRFQSIRTVLAPSMVL